MRREEVLGFRAAATGLDRRARRTAASLVAAARSGLQDTAPRGALLSLHARVSGVRPGDWEAPALVQVWGPRGAVFVVPEADVDVFTLGLLPRSPRRRAEVESVAARVRAVPGVRSAGGARLADVLAALPGMGHRAVAAAAATGELRIRWDTRDTVVRAVPAPARTDVEACRVELARRFLSCLAPATANGFAWWSGAGVVDARATFAALAGELTELAVGSCLATHEDTLRSAVPHAGVRLLPAGDPYLNCADRELVAPRAAVRAAVWPRGTVAPGAVLADGELVATWRRSGGAYTFGALGRVPRQVRAAVEEEAHGTARCLGVASVTVAWAR